jgi:serine/threonine-protein kinase RsbW
MAEPLPAALSIRLPTDLVFVRVGRKMIEGLLGAQGWEEDAVEDAALVATELIQNAIEHGSRGDGSEVAEIRVVLDAAGCLLEVLDPGTGKDPRLLLDRDLEAAVPLDAPRGRGLFLVNRLAADLVRRCHPGGGCVVTARVACESA